MSTTQSSSLPQQMERHGSQLPGGTASAITAGSMEGATILKESLPAASTDAEAVSMHVDESTRCPLLKLPGELRNNIYELLFEIDTEHDVDLCEARPPSIAIALTCKQLHAESKLLITEMHRKFVQQTRFVLRIEWLPQTVPDTGHTARDALRKMDRVCAVHAVSIDHVDIELKRSPRGSPIWVLEDKIWRLEGEEFWWNPRPSDPLPELIGYLPMDFKDGLEELRRSGCDDLWSAHDGTKFVKFAVESAISGKAVRSMVRDRRITGTEILAMVDYAAGLERALSLRRW